MSGTVVQTERGGREIVKDWSLKLACEGSTANEYERERKRERERGRERTLKVMVTPQRDGDDHVLNQGT